MSDEELYNIDVETLLPQRPPFVLIDHLAHFDETVTVTTLRVRDDNIFTEGDRLNPCALMENIAQTCAARLGYINKYIYHRDVAIGYVGAVKNLNVERVPLVGEQLTTSIAVREEVMNLTLVDATVRIGSETVCTAEMKIAIAET